MVKEEEKIEEGDIWVASPDLLEDLPGKDQHGGHFCNVVSKNLGRGVKYRYFVPETNGMHTKVNRLRAFHNDSSNLSVTYLNKDRFFFLIGGLDVTIYNPFAKGGAEPTMYLGIPSRTGDRGQYQVCTNSTFTGQVVDRLNMELDDKRIA